MVFYKYHGCGNDFLISNYDNKVDYSNIIPAICNRKTGIGADGVMLLERTNEIIMNFFNADGSLGAMCGNGIRCFAKYCLDQGVFNSDEFNITTLAGVKKINVITNSDKELRCTVNLGKATFKMTVYDKELINKPIVCLGKEYVVSTLNTGPNHLVTFCDDVEKITEDEAHALSYYKEFSDSVNVNFVQVINDGLKIKTYERGVGFTDACGTGASASFVMANMNGFCANSVKVFYPTGVLKISYEGTDVILEGPAVRVGKVEI